MNDRRVPTLTKWPFYAADLILLGVAFWILNHYPHPLPLGAAILLTGCVALAAILGVLPHRMEYQTAVKFAESDGLNNAVTQINKAEVAADQIRNATGQWQGVQEHSAKTVAAAKEISDRISAEAQAFADFMQKANDGEKATLRLEVEKLRRAEGQWLQVLVHLLDHVFALHQAGARSGQPNLEAQLVRFQEACRDAVRRIGVTPFEAAANEVFDAERHQVVEGQPEPAPAARVAQTLAAGYSFQGQIVRKTLVALQADGAVETQVQQDAAAESTIEAVPCEFDASVELDGTPASGSTATDSNLNLSAAGDELEQKSGQSFRLEADPLQSPDSERERSS